MAIKGFIIAIEDYNGYLPNLPGVVEQSAEFRKWLIDKKQVDESNIYACISSGYDWQTAGTGSNDIIKELKRLKEEGVNKTQELYFYFSGHGFSLPVTPDKNIDVLIASDYDGPDTGRACIALDEIKEKLYRMLGPGNHYYFIDACRNIIENIQVPLTGLKTEASELGTPSVYRLFSTASGAVAKTSSNFTEILVNGLSGKGIAKDWKGHRMWVLFDRLCDFIKLQIKQQEIIYSKEGTDEGKILEIVPIPEFYCQIKINNAQNDDTFEISIDTAQGFTKKEKFTGPLYKVQLRPGYYSISLASDPSNSAKLIQIDPNPSEEPLSLFDPCEISFEKKSTDINSGFIDSPPIAVVDSEISEEDNKELEKDIVESRDDTFGEDQHLVRPLAQPSGRVLKSVLNKISNKELLNLISGNALDEIVQAPGQDRSDGKPNGLGLLLALLGASRIVFNSSEYKKLFKLQLTEFDDVRIGQSEVYILAGFEKANGILKIAVGNEINVKWESISQVKGIKGLYERRMQASPGSNLLSIKIPKMPSLTYSIYCLPNRITFFVVAEDINKHIKVHQFILPLHHLFNVLDPKVIKHMAEHPLKLIKSVFLAQKQFALKRRVSGEEGMPEKQWRELIYGKWLDPIMSIIGAYELVREGEIKNNRDFLKSMLGNLKKYFPGLPDTEAIAKLIGEPWNIPIGPPLLLDGMLAFDDAQERGILPMPPDKIDFSSPWTRWYGVF